MRKMTKFKNIPHKVKVILNAFNGEEKLTGREIARRINEMGYRVSEGHIKMFIYHYMLHKYLKKEVVRGVNYYFLAQ